MKRFKIVYAIVMLLIIFVIFNYQSGEVDSSASIKMNWNIIIDNANEKYYKTSRGGFHGDGYSYHIFEYEDDSSIKNIKLSKEQIKPIFYNNYEEQYKDILKKLNVDKKHKPNYEKCEYYYEKATDNSEIIIMVDKESKIIYVLESFL